MIRISFALLALMACTEKTSDDSQQANGSEPCEGGLRAFFVDGDGDGFGAGIPVMSCDGAAGLVSTVGDCDDSDPEVSPAAEEVCDPSDVDEDCNGAADDADPDFAPPTWYLDEDGDGVGTAVELVGCTQPPNTAPESGDCDDSDPAVNPYAKERCDPNDVDEDCNGLADDDDEPDPTSLQDWFSDLDGDGYGYGGVHTQICGGGPNWSLVDTDCDDSIATTFPGAVETCDGIDSDCDGAPMVCWADEPGPRALADAEIELTGLGADDAVRQVGDLNGDGFPDLLVGFRPVYGPLTPGSQSLPQLPAVGTLSHLALVRSDDFNGDGLDDLVLADVDTVQIWVAPFGANADCDLVIPGGLILDVLPLGPNADGEPQLALAYLADYAEFYVEVRTGSCLESVEARFTGDGKTLAVGDFDGDGVRTLVVGGFLVNSGDPYLPGGYYLLDEPWQGTGEIDSFPAMPVVGFENAMAVDANGDGTDELIVGWSELTFLGTYGSVWPGPRPAGFTLSEGLNQELDLDATSALSSGDINADGFLDWVVSTEGVELSLGGPQQGFIAFSDGYEPGTYSDGPFFWDANHDGYDDVVVRVEGGPVYISLGGPQF